MSSIRSVLFHILLLIFGAALSFFVLEIGFRAFHSSESPGWSDRPVSYFRPPGSKTFQDYPFSREKPLNTYRIVVIGDSFTFGPMLQLDDTFPKRLEKFLNMNRFRFNVEVINMGVPGHSTWHHIATAREALRYSPDLLLLDITLNDVAIEPLRNMKDDESYDFRPYRPAPWVAPVLTHWKSLDYMFRRVHASRLNQRHKAYYLNMYANESAYQKFTNSLKEISRLARLSDTPLVATIFPLFGEKIDSAYPFTSIHRKVSNTLESLSIPFLDLLPHYSNIPADRLTIKPGKDSHPNEIAHRIAAEALYKWMKERSIIPASLHVRRMPQRRYSPK